MSDKNKIESLKGEIERLKHQLSEAENSKLELTKRIFHQKTLYDISKEICELKDTDEIMKNFLMMIMGTFGILQGFILMGNRETKKCERFVHRGLEGDLLASLEKESDLGGLFEDVSAVELLDVKSAQAQKKGLACDSLIDRGVTHVIYFPVDNKYFGLLGMGNKISGGDYHSDEKELLTTLTNNLLIFVRNANSFEVIKKLNEHLQEKNMELENTLKQLQATLRKVEILENAKFHLAKFVPYSVRKIIEESPEFPQLGKRKQDVSILFLDIAGYTKMTEALREEQINYIVEKYFSRFIDDIHQNQGDINETAGDGLMVIFPEEDRIKNAVQAVRTAISIRDKTKSINHELEGRFQPLVINMGINSGDALLGAVKYESYVGARWTYTARGMTTNVAARIGGCAKNGSILLSKATTERIGDQFKTQCIGAKRLKNVKKPVEIFEIKE